LFYQWRFTPEYRLFKAIIRPEIWLLIYDKITGSYSISDFCVLIADKNCQMRWQKKGAVQLEPPIDGWSFQDAVVNFPAEKMHEHPRSYHYGNSIFYKYKGVW
jgi:hypothetical protein